MVVNPTPGKRRFVLLSMMPASISGRTGSVTMPLCKPRCLRWPSWPMTQSGSEPIPTWSTAPSRTRAATLRAICSSIASAGVGDTSCGASMASTNQSISDTRLAVSEIDWFVDAMDAPQEVSPTPADAIDEQIARNVAALVRDGAVLQVGIGSLPDCVMGQLGHLKHLGLHSGIVTDPVRPLIEAGIIDNSTKRRFPGVGLTTMAAGTQSFYDFLHCNRAIEFHPCSLTHNAAVLAGIDGLCAINSALQVDLAGNVNAEFIDGRQISLPGGLPDFAAGARQG